MKPEVGSRAVCGARRAVRGKTNCGVLRAVKKSHIPQTAHPVPFFILPF